MKWSKRIAVAVSALLAGAVLAPTPVDARGGGGRGGGRGGRGGRGGGKEYKDRREMIQELEQQMRISDRDARFASGRESDRAEVRRAGLDASLHDIRRAGEDRRRSETARVETPH